MIHWCNHCVISIVLCSSALCFLCRLVPDKKMFFSLFHIYLLTTTMNVIFECFPYHILSFDMKLCIHYIHYINKKIKALISRLISLISCHFKWQVLTKTKNGSIAMQHCAKQKQVNKRKIKSHLKRKLTIYKSGFVRKRRYEFYTQIRFLFPTFQRVRNFWYTFSKCNLGIGAFYW